MRNRQVLKQHKCDQLILNQFQNNSGNPSQTMSVQPLKTQSKNNHPQTSKQIQKIVIRHDHDNIDQVATSKFKNQNKQQKSDDANPGSKNTSIQDRKKYTSGSEAKCMDRLDCEFITSTLKQQANNDNNFVQPSQTDPQNDLNSLQQSLARCNTSNSRDRSNRREVVRVTSNQMLKSNVVSEFDLQKNSQAQYKIEDLAETEEGEKQKQFSNTTVLKGFQSYQNLDNDDHIDKLQNLQLQHVNEHGNFENTEVEYQPSHVNYPQNSFMDPHQVQFFKLPRRIVSRMLSQNQKNKILVDKMVKQNIPFTEIQYDYVPIIDSRPRSANDVRRRDSDIISVQDIQQLNLQQSYNRMFHRVDGLEAERVLRDIQKKRPIKKNAKTKFEKLVDHSIKNTRCYSAIQLGSRNNLNQLTYDERNPLTLLKKFTSKINKRYYFPQNQRFNDIQINNSIINENRSEYSVDDKEIWEKSQRSSGIIDKQDLIELDYQRYLYKIIKEKLTGKVHRTFMKQARELNDGSNRTHADNVGLYNCRTRYAMKYREDDTYKKIKHQNQQIAIKVNKSRKHQNILNNTPPNMPAYKSYIDFSTQLERPDLIKTLNKMDDCTKNIDFCHCYQAVDQKNWISPNNGLLFINQRSHNDYYPGKQVLHMHEPKPNQLCYLD